MPLQQVKGHVTCYYLFEQLDCEFFKDLAESYSSRILAVSTVRDT